MLDCCFQSHAKPCSGSLADSMQSVMIPSSMWATRHCARSRPLGYRSIQICTVFNPSCIRHTNESSILPYCCSLITFPIPSVWSRPLCGQYTTTVLVCVVRLRPLRIQHATLHRTRFRKAARPRGLHRVAVYHLQKGYLRHFPA